jgi:integrase
LDIQDMYAAESKSKISGTMINYHHRILRAAFNQAVKWRMIHQNPCLGASAPSKNIFEPVMLTPEQEMEIFKYLQDDPVYPVVVIAAMTGMRRGEVCALQWNDINFISSTITVSKSLKREKGKGLVLGPTKTKQKRIVPISPILKDFLTKLKENNSYDYVCCWTENGRSIDPDHVTKKFNAALQELNLPQATRFHDLRHLHGTLMLEAGADIRTISDELGHSGTTITSNLYLHPDIQRRKDMVNKMDALFSKDNQ